MDKSDFYYKNSLGVLIGYSIIGIYKDETDKYLIYTDFASDDSKYGIKLYVSKLIFGMYFDVSKDLREEVLKKYDQTIAEYVEKNFPIKNKDNIERGRLMRKLTACFKKLDELKMPDDEETKKLREEYSELLAKQKLTQEEYEF